MSVDELANVGAASQGDDGVCDEIQRNAIGVLGVGVQCDERGDAAKSNVHEQDEDTGSSGYKEKYKKLIGGDGSWSR